MGLIRASSVLRRNQTATTAAIYEGIIDALPTAFWKDPKFVSYGASAAELDKCIISGFSTALHSPSNLVVYDTTAAYLRSGVVPLSPAAFRTPCSLLRPTRFSLPSFIVGLDRVLTCRCQTKLMYT